tara:strand:- start:40 stop:1239 length:1200 start_codon:yes stop_codon:yes gene_type:complete
VAGIFLPGSARGGTGDITAVTAGTGLSGGGPSGALTLTLDLSELSAVTPADGDSLATIDSDGANEQLTTVAALATLFSGDGLAASSSVMGVDLVSNGGLEISSNKLQVATGISQYDVAQFAASVADNDFLRIDSTAVEGRSASEVLSDISAAPAAGDSNILTVGALDSGSITSGFGAIDNGTSGIRTNTFTVETSIVPDASGGADIGTNALEWGDVYIADDKKIYLGSGQDVSLEYDEDGTDQLRIAGSTIFQNNIELGEAASVSIGTPLLPTADHTYSGISAEMLAGGAIAAFNLVCIHTTTQEVVVADASAIGTARVIGIAPAAISDTATGTVLLQGFIRDDTWTWTPGSPLYLSETAGAMTHTAPTTSEAFVVVVGIALSPDVAYINPSVDIIEHA